MEKCFSVKVIDGITITCFFNKPTLLDAKKAMDEALLTAQCRLMLWDLKEGIDLPAEQLKEIARYGKKVNSLPSRAGIIASDDVSFGLMRIYDAYREQEQHETRVFRSRQQAIKWLKEFI